MRRIRADPKTARLSFKKNITNQAKHFFYGKKCKFKKTKKKKKKRKGHHVGCDPLPPDPAAPAELGDPPEVELS